MTAPPELAAATEQPLLVSGGAMAALVVPSDSSFLLDQVVGGSSTAILTVEDIRAERNPGLVYDVFLNLPEGVAGSDGDFYYTGSFTLFGIEQLNDPDHVHDGATGMRHSFDATAVIRGLAGENLWSSQEVSVTVEPVAGPGEDWADSSVEVQVGRIGLFVTSTDGSRPVA